MSQLNVSKPFPDKCGWIYGADISAGCLNFGVCELIKRSIHFF